MAEWSENQRKGEEGLSLRQRDHSATWQNGVAECPLLPTPPARLQSNGMGSVARHRGTGTSRRTTAPVASPQASVRPSGLKTSEVSAAGSSDRVTGSPPRSECSCSLLLFVAMLESRSAS